MGYLKFTNDVPSRTYSGEADIKWYMDSWDPMQWNDPKWVGDTDLSLFPQKEWMQGEWHHVLINVDKYLRQADLYIDGILMSSAKGIRTLEDPLEMVLEGNPSGRTLIDNLFLFPYPLGNAEAAYLFGKKGEAFLPFPPDVELKTQIYREFLYLDQKLRVGVDARDRAETVKFELYNGLEKVRELEISGGDCGYFEDSLDVRTLPLGEYRLVAMLYKGDKNIGEVDAVFDKDDNTTWESAREIGVSDRVLRPWTPLKIKNDKTIECWGREYRFDKKTGFVDSIVSQGQEILRSPVRFETLAAGNPLTWKMEKYRVAKNTPAEIILETVHTDPSKHLTLSVVYRTEFDGAVFMDISLEPKQSGVILDRFSLALPLKTEVTRYISYTNEVYHHSDELGIPFMADFGFTFPRKEPVPIHQVRNKNGYTIEGNRRSMFFLPWLYLGNENIGFSYACEEMRDWVTDETNETRMLELVREGDITTFYLNLIKRDTPFELRKGLHWTIALQATPVKAPYPADVRDRRFGHFNCSPFMGGGDYHPHQNCAEVWYTRWGLGWGNRARDKESMRQAVAYVHQKDMIYYPHVTMTYASELEPEVWKYGEEMRKVPWKSAPGRYFEFLYSQARKDPDFVGLDFFRREPGNLKDTPFVQYLYYWLGTCQGSSRLQDYLVWCYKYASEQYGWDGVHFDVGDIYPCINEKHGCGYIDINGKKRPSWAVFGERNILKRILALYQEQGKDPMISGALLPRCTIAVGFSNDIQTGEWWMFQLREGLNMLDLLTNDDFLAMLSPKSTGIPVTLMQGQTQLFGPDDPRSKSFVMMCLLHDMNFLAGRSHKMLQDVNEARYHFGLADTKFLPYWNIMGKSVSIFPEGDVKVSIYPKTDGRKAMVVLGNLDREKKEVRLRFDMKSLELKAGGTVKDALTGEILADTPDLPVEVDGWGFRLLVLE